MHAPVLQEPEQTRRRREGEHTALHHRDAGHRHDGLRARIPKSNRMAARSTEPVTAHARRTEPVLGPRALALGVLGLRARFGTGFSVVGGTRGQAGEGGGASARASKTAVAA